MAGPAAVPGVDPSRVSTPDELAVCLDGLRRRRDLSYEAMEAAAKLLSRSGGSRLEPLPKTAVGEIVTGKRLPTKGKLVTFLAVCGVAPADLAQWLAAWERARTADLAPPAGAVRVRDARPRLLGVHDAIQVEEKVPGELPVYVPRDIDDGLRVELAANAQRGCFVLLIGGSSVGKTRTLYEAVLAALPDWWLVHPAGPGEVTALAAAPAPRTVVWLDELQRYLDGEHGLTGATVRALLNAPHPAVIIGTLWPDRYTAYTAMPEPGGADPRARERELLDLADVVRVGPEFSPAEQDRARAAAARDRRLTVALESAGYGLTQTLAAAPQLVARWQDTQTSRPYAWAVLTAALDVARLGARSPLSADLLRAAAPGYCTSQQRAEAPGNWFEQALAYATGKLHGAAAALSPAGADMGQVSGYIVADYLIQHASRERRYVRVPASSWDAVLSYIRDPADAARLADSASNRLLYRYAILLYHHAADAGDRDAATRLAGLLAERGDLDGAIQVLGTLADAGDRDAASRLADLLAERGDLDGAIQVLGTLADAGDQDAATRLVRLLAKRGDLDELRTRADAGDTAAATHLLMLLAQRGDADELRTLADAGDILAGAMLDGLLVERGDLDELRTRAAGGHIEAALRLVRLLAERGDLDELRTRADAGNEDAASRLVRLLADRGDLDELRTRADAGNEDAASRLAGLLADRGDLDELRTRADAGNEDAASRLAGLLADRGDLDELRTRADAGNEDAASRLAGLLADSGDLDELRTRADAGDRDAASRLAGLLADSGDLDGAIQLLRTLADAADRDAATRLAGLLADRGDLDELRTRADAGDIMAAVGLAESLAERGDLDGAMQLLRTRVATDDEDAASLLVTLLASRGDLDGLRARVDAGDTTHAGARLARLLADRGDADGLCALADVGAPFAALQLADLLAERGDLDGLRTRADAGDYFAADRLARLLAERGDLDGLRARADAGDGDAARRLPDLMAKQGRVEEAARLRRFGLNPDGSIALALGDAVPQVLKVLE